MHKAKKRSLTQLADAAFQEVAVQLLEQAKQSGTPIIVWEDGRVKALSSTEIERRMARSTGKKARSKPRTKN